MTSSTLRQSAAHALRLLTLGIALCPWSARALLPTGAPVETLRLKGQACAQVFPISAGRRVVVCGRSLYMAPVSTSAAQPKLLGRLRDDDVWAVRELAVSPEVPVGSDAVSALVLIDTGAELCFGTQVLGVMRSGAIKPWGTLDQVVAQGDDVKCLSSVVKLDLAGADLSLTLPSPHWRPTQDGRYLKVNRSDALPMVRGGRFCQKGTPCGVLPGEKRRAK